MNVAKLQKMYLGIYETAKKKLISKNVKGFVRKSLCNKNVLSEEEDKKVSDFWSHYVKIDPVFHAFYKEKAGVFDPLFVPHDVYINQVDAYFNIREASWWLDHKCLYDRLFTGIRQPVNIAYRMGGFWYDAQWQPLSMTQVLALISLESATVVKAATRSECGNGVQFIEGGSEGIVSAFKTALEKQTGDIVIQRPLIQHESLSVMHPSSVNTLRIISLLTEDGPKIYSTIVRMGGCGERIDNNIATGLFCGVKDTGELAPYAYRLNGDRFEAHPSSGFVFKGHRLAGVEKAQELVRKAAIMLPLFRLVSWDIVIDSDGEPLMLECNLAKGSISYHQLTNGPLFGEDTRKVLDEVFGKV